VLATVLFTDIVDSTGTAHRMGDTKWHDVLDAHNEMVRSRLARFRGREIEMLGDGFLATFDGPARAIQCALEIHRTTKDLGLRVRAGVHTGEVQLVNGDVEGIAVHIAARVIAAAPADEVLVSRTVKDLVAGSGITLEKAGVHTLKGVPEEWELYRALA
jgi:class 3 adenylate cyclase